MPAAFNRLARDRRQRRGCFVLRDRIAGRTPVTRLPEGYAAIVRRLRREINRGRKDRALRRERVAPRELRIDVLWIDIAEPRQPSLAGRERRRAAIGIIVVCLRGRADRRRIGRRRCKIHMSIGRIGTDKMGIADNDVLNELISGSGITSCTRVQATYIICDKTELCTVPRYLGRVQFVFKAYGFRPRFE